MPPLHTDDTVKHEMSLLSTSGFVLYAIFDCDWRPHHLPGRILFVDCSDRVAYSTPARAQTYVRSRQIFEGSWWAITLGARSSKRLKIQCSPFLAIQSNGCADVAVTASANKTTKSRFRFVGLGRPIDDANWCSWRLSVRHINKVKSRTVRWGREIFFSVRPENRLPIHGSHALRPGPGP
jgi:hypothetical protein